MGPNQFGDETVTSHVKNKMARKRLGSNNLSSYFSKKSRDESDDSESESRKYISFVLITHAQVYVYEKNDYKKKVTLIMPGHCRRICMAIFYLYISMSRYNYK